MLWEEHFEQKVQYQTLSRYLCPFQATQSFVVLCWVKFSGPATQCSVHECVCRSAACYFTLSSPPVLGRQPGAKSAPGKLSKLCQLITALQELKLLKWMEQFTPLGSQPSKVRTPSALAITLTFHYLGGTRSDGKEPDMLPLCLQKVTLTQGEVPTVCLMSCFPSPLCHQSSLLVTP